MLPLQGTQVRSLVGELRSHMPCSEAKKKKEKGIIGNEKKSQTIKYLMGHVRKYKYYLKSMESHWWVSNQERCLAVCAASKHQSFWKQCKKWVGGTSLVAQWIRICLPMQGTWVRTLVWEDPTCRGATRPVRHNYWACALEPASHNYWAHVPQLLKPTHLEPMLRNKRSHSKEKPAHRNEE